VKDTFAVVVNWNGGDDCLSCVDSLLEQGLGAQRIVLVDNASTDGSPERVAERWPDVVLLRQGENLGYGDGTNVGLRWALGAGARRLLLVNNDLVFAGSDSVARLAALLDSDPGIGVVGPRIVYRDEPERIWAAGGRMTWRRNLSNLLGHRRPDGPRWSVRRDVDYVPGCALLVRRDVLERVGLLEGDYFAYHEDVEFCLQVRAAGWRVVVEGEVLALHGAHASTGGGYNPRRKYMMGVNTVRFLRRHGTPWRWAQFLVFDVLSLPFVWCWRALHGEGAAVRAKARGMLEGWRGGRVGADSVADSLERPG